MTYLNELTDQLILVPKGTIHLRDDRTHRKWSTEVQAFFLGRFPVTQDLYFKVTGFSPAATTCANCPVEGVSWLEAARFCNQVSLAAGLTEFYQIKDDDTITTSAGANGFRLPTEAEWEYACRAGSQGPRYGDLDAIAWYHENSEGRTHPVGSKKENAWGFHDMLGNVWEWCSDLYDPEVYGDYRIFRGGGWSDEARGCLVTNRRRGHPTFKIDDLGFRIARSID